MRRRGFLASLGLGAAVLISGLRVDELFLSALSRAKVVQFSGENIISGLRTQVYNAFAYGSIGSFHQVARLYLSTKDFEDLNEILEPRQKFYVDAIQERNLVVFGVPAIPRENVPEGQAVLVEE